MSYFEDIRKGIQTTLGGLKLTLRHLRQAAQSRKPMGVEADNYFEQQTGIVTLQYPHEQLPIPDNGRYRLHNEIDDCIVCDKCAKICPVDCITIDPIKATEEIGKASDGSPIRLYAATFDIDMAKCCYCGLCTVVCPTECLTMEKTFDYSEYELGKLTYNFANLTLDQADEKRSLYEQFVREKEELKAQQATAKAAEVVTESESTAVPKPRPAFRPGAKPAAATPVPPAETPALPEPNESVEAAKPAEPTPRPRPVFKPTVKPASSTPAPPTETPASTAADVPAEIPKATESAPRPRPVFKPTAKPAAPKPEDSQPTEPVAEIKPEPVTPAETPAPKRPVFRPTQKPAAAATPEPADENQSAVPGNSTEGNIKHPLTDPAPDEAEQIAMEGIVDKTNVTEPMTATEKEDAVLPEPAEPVKPAFRPTMKPAAKAVDPASDEPTVPEPPAAPGPAKKPAFRPMMKSKPSEPDSAE